MMKLDKLTLEFNLPVWKKYDFESFKRSTNELKSIGQKAGVTSDRFKQIFEQFKQYAGNGEGYFLKQIKSATHARVLVHLWLKSDMFYTLVPISKPLLNALKRDRSGVSQLCLQGLLDIFFHRFDTLKNIDGFTAYLHAQLRKSSGEYSENAKLSRNAKQILSINGPKWLSEQAQKSSVDLANLIPKMGLDAYQNTRFIEVTKHNYYLKQLEAISASDSTNPIFDEVSRKDVYESPYSDQEFLGHKIISILIDRTHGNDVPKHWQKVVLTIAGDPRVPTSSNRYQRWWSNLGEARIRKVRGWLAGLDLKLFLEALKQSAKDQHLSDMERMFESRKVFMEGLLNEGVVSDSRLFLSSSAERYLKRMYKQEELPDYALNGSPDTSVIYLNVGGVHMIEGSHSFKLKLMDKLPTHRRLRLLDFSKKKFDDYSFREQLKQQYYSEYGLGKHFFDAAHDQHLNWQNKSLQFLKEHGVHVRPDKVLSKLRYKEYKQKFGIK